MISTMTMFIGDDDLKHRKNCESCPTQVIWKVKFKCQICLSCLSSLSDLSGLSIPCVLSVLSLLMTIMSMKTIPF